MFLGGLDIGTTGCKLTVYDDGGNWITNAYQEYEITRSSGAHEIDASVIWNGVCQVMKEAANEVPELAAVGVTSFGESFVMLDKEDRILFPTMLYTDSRGKEEIDLLKEHLSEKKLTEISGTKPHHTYSIGKIMWIKKHRPEIYKQVKRVFLIADFIVYRLTGQAMIDYSLAARTAAFDIRNLCFSQEIFDAAGLDISLMSKPVKMGTSAGPMKKELRKEFGFSNDVTVIIGGHDQISAAIGAGVLTPGEAVDGTGTVECITPVFEGIPQEEGMYESHYSVIPFLFDHTYVCYAYSYTGGAAVKWFRDTFRENTDYQKLDQNIPDRPTDILVLPHFAGAATPYMDSDSKAAFVGVTLETTAEELYKAVMEGVTYEIKMNLERLAQNGISPRYLKATGGGAKSEKWLQIKADILGIPIIATDAMEAGACGNCMMAGVSLGVFQNFAQAATVLIREKKTYLPDEKRHAQYQQRYKRYQQLYQAVRPLLDI